MTLDIDEILTNNPEFTLIIDDMIKNNTVQSMNLYKHHYDTSCFEHCIHVAFLSYQMAKKFNLDYVSCARAGLVHDLFLYDWHERQPDRKGLHAYTHPKAAFVNASKLFALNPIEKDMIVKHMWPVTLSLPRYSESYLITFADKYAALAESFHSCKQRARLSKLQKLYRYGYVLLSMLVLRIV